MLLINSIDNITYLLLGGGVFGDDDVRHEHSNDLQVVYFGFLGFVYSIDIL